MKRFFLILPCLLTIWVLTSCGNDEPNASTKKERNLIVEGNQFYTDGKYTEAEAAYRKALTENPNSEMALFNLASALLRQAPEAQKNAPQAQTDSTQNQMSEQLSAALEILQNLAENSPTSVIAGAAAYDLGNIAYRQQNYPQAIECYKQALRKLPKNEDARYNLRMAQLKNKNNQNQNNQNQNKDKDQKDKDKNKDQNKDKENKDKENKDKENNDNKKQNQNNQQQQQDKGGMSKQNMEQILRSMQNQENATQQRVNAARAKQQEGERVRTQNKW